MHEFWSISDKGILQISITEIYQFLNEKGYRRESRDKETILYQVDAQFIDLVDKNNMINEVIRYLKVDLHNYEDSRYIEYPKKPAETFTFSNLEILEAVTNKVTFKKIFSPENFNLLRPLDCLVKRHTHDKAFFYFKNGFVEITAKDYQIRPYSDLNYDEKVYRPLIIDREIEIINVGTSEAQSYARKGADFYHFLSMISGKLPSDPKEEYDLNAEYAENEEKRAYLMKLLGYMMHDYKEHGKTDFAAFICDENVGGTGKGTIAQALVKMLGKGKEGGICEIDGGKAQEKYDPADLTVQTRLKVYNDITRNFLSNSIYNEITDSASMRPMHSGYISIPYEKSWKISVLANFTISGGDGHLLRRFAVYYMTPFFHRERTIIDYYGHSFWGKSWENKDWVFFYNIMFWCMKLWLSSDYKIKYEDPDYIQFKIESTYYPEFIEFIDDLPKGYYKNKDLFNDFKKNHKWQFEDHIKKITSNTFGRFLTNYLNETKREWSYNCNRTERYIGALKGRNDETPADYHQSSIF